MRRPGRPSRRGGPLALLLILASGAAPGAPATLTVPAGRFVQGSDAAEREAAYRLDQAAYGSDITRRQGWYAGELPRQWRATGRYAIMRTPVTNGDYAAFVAATDHPAPDVTPETWAGYGLIHPYAATRRFAWQDGRPPPGREAHPVVLVSRADAAAYARWLSAETGRRWRLPSEAEWERAARGDNGRRFPWGERFDAMRLNSADAGPFDTQPVGRFPDGASPWGVLDMAGQVYEWTVTPSGRDRSIVKGGSWDDRGCGVCRPAARHSRPNGIRHILIGFRLVREEGKEP